MEATKLSLGGPAGNTCSGLPLGDKTVLDCERTLWELCARAYRADTHSLFRESPVKAAQGRCSYLR